MTSSGVFVNLIPGPGTLVLNAAHPFTVTLSATDPHTGAAASGVATQGNDLWGYFSIPAITGNPDNPEVFVKLLDGTAINGEYWFFYGGLTDLEYTLTVTDVTTGKQKTYTKPANSECGGSECRWLGAMKNRVLGTLVFLVVSTTNISVGQEVVEFVIPTPAAGVAGLAAGPDGNIWFTNYSERGSAPVACSQRHLAH